MLKAQNFRLDWRSELSRVSRYIDRGGGVVLLEYNSDDAAPDIFNHTVKEMFAASNANGPRQSLRIDRAWFTTRRIEGILEEFDRLLTDSGFPAEPTPWLTQGINLVVDNKVQGDLTANIQGKTFVFGERLQGKALALRTASVCAAMRRFTEGGGRFMIVVNDTPLEEQSAFWQQIWNAGLSEAGGTNCLLVIHAGPEARQRKHQDCPPADERIVIPDSVETDETRQDHIYDDLIGIFQKHGIENAVECAVTHLASNTKSVLKLHVNLSAAIMMLKLKLGVAGG